MTLHIGDQFLSAGANDFKVSFCTSLSLPYYEAYTASYQARLASTTAWIANPAETVELLDELELAVNPR